MRIWSNRQQPGGPPADDGSIHGMGNGEMLACAQGPNLAQLFGPPYTSPVILSLGTEYDGPLCDEAIREEGAAIWNHRMASNGQPVLEFTECVAADLNVYLRRFTCYSAGLRWVIRPHSATTVVPAALSEPGWLLLLGRYQRMMFYPDTLAHHTWVLPQGSCRAERNEAGEIVVTLEPGEGSLAIVGATDYGRGVLTAEEVLHGTPEVILRSTRRAWATFTQQRLRTAPIEAAQDPEAGPALDTAAVLLKALQGNDGGLLASHLHQFVYARDSYGAARGLLAAGMHEEARRALRFRMVKFEHFGTVQTAESSGSVAVRHVHENDEVEGPAYTILQARDYLEATGDEAFVRSLWPMLSWCWMVQLRHLVGGMLPFNGDETYVAGGFFPRAGLNHGSADSTLAFVEAGRWLAPWASAQGLWTRDQAAAQRALVTEARAAYRARFLNGDRIWANDPGRETMAPMPRFRFGVCESCITRRFGWTERSPNGRYLCPVCLAGDDPPPLTPPRMEVYSVSMLPAYLGSDVLTPDETRRVVDRVLGMAEPDGTIPSVPGEHGFVGYDPALILFNLTAASSADGPHPRAAEGYRRVLNVRDSTGAWVEYYLDDHTPRPGCSRSRTWETGVSADAIVGYLRALRT